MFEFLKNLFVGHDFIQEENEALLDLLTLAMYSDGHVAEEELQNIADHCDFMDWRSVKDQTEYISESKERAKKNLETDELTVKYLRDIASRLTEPDFRRLAKKALFEMLHADEILDPKEAKFLGLFKSVFG